MTGLAGPQSAAGHEYRPDIDGLRAIAVLSVLLFHLDLGAFTGGFVGVDIFFVISGYLITSLIYAELQRGTFSLSDFYVRRVRRIFPALYLTIVLTLAAGSLIFEPHETRPLLDALGYLAVFFSNAHFMRAGGYFDAPLGAHPLLQTWSLSVEEQFYVGFPLLFMLAHRFARPYLRSLIVVVAAVSLTAGAVRVNIDPQKAFFATELRIFELMIGTIVALGLPPLLAPAARMAVAALGFVLMSGNIFLLSSSVPFPGPSALPVCVGTALIIWAGERGRSTAINRMLAWPPLVSVGLISYSVYLLHWPLIVFAKRLLLTELTIGTKAGLAIAAMAGGYLSWRFVETPFRRMATKGRGVEVFAIAVALICVLGLGSTTSLFLTLPTGGGATEVERQLAAAEPCSLHPSMPPHNWSTENCVSGNAGPFIVVWGDSYAGHYFNAFRDLAAKSGVRLALFASGSCPPAVGLELREWPQCRHFNDMVIKELGTLKPQVVVLSAHWLNYEKRRSLLGNDVIQQMRNTISSLRNLGAKVLVIGPSPIFPSSVPLIALARSGPAQAGHFHARYSKAFDDFFRDLQTGGHLRYFPTYTVFCGDSLLCRFRDEEALFFWDSGHMTTHGANHVVERLAEGLLSTVVPN